VKEQCENCRFWRRPEAQAEKAAGNCLRHAPRPWGAGYVGVDTVVDESIKRKFCSDALWPTTYRDEWCGEWRSR
jgi:hypothetical protein